MIRKNMCLADVTSDSQNLGDIFVAMNASLLPALTWILGVFFKQLPDELPKTESQWADIFLDVPEIIKKSGYPVEVHHVTTEDGYIVTLHRLPRRMSEKAPTLVQHGIFHSSADSIISGPNSGLADMTVEKLIKEDDLTHCGTTFHDSRVNLHSAANIKGRKKKVQKCYTLPLDQRPPDHLTSHCYLHYRPDALLCLQLGYSLYDAGYDVWLGNSRGNYYSRKHVNMTKSDPKFWDFSWHDMGVHDIPAVIDYILDHTGHKDLFFIGHSMGCAMFFVGMAAKPRYNDKIRVMFGLGPASYMHNGKSTVELNTTSVLANYATEAG
uniref:Triacylglycerol lipase n=1 Tax=Timema douglasi TaxID=61478 RepID=A0A7R8VUN8_TIMDO|nr:unnamed protein product [Timema douglasi]